MPSSKLDALFQPLTIKSLHLNNRIVMAPMTRKFSPQGVPGEDVAQYYRRRAENDVGLIISEGTAINRPAARNEQGVPFFYGDAPLTGWKNVIEEVHAAGGKMCPQLWHVGAMAGVDSDATSDNPAESPSGLLAPKISHGVTMSEEDIADTIAAFSQGIVDAKRLGFDTVEIHGASGYLLDQFFWAETNLRTDAYGGATLKQRTRFAAEVVESMRKAVGPDFPIILRLSQWKINYYDVRMADTPDAMSKWLMPLVEAGVDILHCSQRRFWEPEFPQIDGKEGLNFAGWAKKLTGATTISVGSVGLSGEFTSSFAGESVRPASLDNLVQRLEKDEFDLIAVGRALLGDPQWVRKVREGKTEGLKDFNVSELSTLF